MTEQQIGQHRPAKNVQPGWHLHTDDGWFEVSMIAHTTNMLTGQKLIRVVFTDGSTFAAGNGSTVLCRTIPEARRAVKREATR